MSTKFYAPQLQGYFFTVSCYKTTKQIVIAILKGSGRGAVNVPIDNHRAIDPKFYIKNYPEYYNFRGDHSAMEIKFAI